MATFKSPTHNQNGKKSGSVPVCPNHGEPLEGLPNPMTAKGVGICPVSRVRFEYEVDIESADTTYIKDHNGNLVAVPGYTVTCGEEEILKN